MLAFLASGSAFVLQQQNLKPGEVLLANGGILGTSQCDLLWIYYQQTNSCYYAGDKLNFDAAEANCASLGGHLSSVHNAFENSFIASLTESGQKQEANGMTWIGLHFAGNNWVWTDGSVNAYQYWTKGDPSKVNKEDCAELMQDEIKSGLTTKNKKGEWHNVECDQQMRKYVCKKTPNF